MTEMIRFALHPFWKIFKFLMLKCGVPLERLLEWKLRFFSILYKLFPQRGSQPESNNSYSRPAKWTIEHESSLSVQTSHYWNILNDEWNKNI